MWRQMGDFNQNKWNQLFPRDTHFFWFYTYDLVE